MVLCLSIITRLRTTKRTGQYGIRISDESLAKHSQQNPHIVSIHVLDDDSLLNIFYLYRPSFLGEDENDLDRLNGGREPWDRGRWWYQLAHVCQRWRKLILGSASYLRLSLVCTNGTPVENMLAHSPPFPLTIDYRSKDGITAEDEQGVLLALGQRHRVRHLRLLAPVRNLQKLVMAIDDEFPILEYLIVDRWKKDNTAPLMLSETLQLESLEIAFSFPVPKRDVERQLAHTPITTHITLPNLRLFWFRGVSAYLEAVVCRITAPRLETLQIRLFNQLTFSVPLLPQFINTTENLRFDNAKVVFKDKEIDVLMFFRGAYTYAFAVAVDCRHLDWQVSSSAQISNALSQVLSAVEHLDIEYEVYGQPSEDHNDVDRIEWRKLLRSFGNVKTLYIKDGLVEELSRCLQLEDGERPLDLLPELQELTYFGSREISNGFTSFIDARKNAGRPVTLVRDGPSPSPSLQSFEPPAIPLPSDEAESDIET